MLVVTWGGFLPRSLRSKTVLWLIRFAAISSRFVRRVPSSTVSSQTVPALISRRARSLARSFAGSIRCSKLKPTHGNVKQAAKSNGHHKEEEREGTFFLHFTPHTTIKNLALDERIIYVFLLFFTLHSRSYEQKKMYNIQNPWNNTVLSRKNSSQRTQKKIVESIKNHCYSPRPRTHYTPLSSHFTLLFTLAGSRVEPPHTLVHWYKTVQDPERRRRTVWEFSPTEKKTHRVKKRCTDCGK